MRRRREPLRSLGLRRSATVIDWMIASVRTISRSSKFSSCCFMPPAPGSMPSIFLIEPAPRSCCICCRKSSSVNCSLASFSATLSASSSSKACCACSMRVRMSPRSRMRLAMRSGWNGSKSSSPSPVDAKMMGRPVTDATLSAAPPRASPSSFDSTTPVKSTPSWNAFAVVTASWPIIASMTKSTSSGLVALRMFAACFIISASTPRRPAVSMMTTSCCERTACATASFATFTGSPTPLPGSGAKTGTPAWPPTTWSWFTAFGRWRSAATSIGVWPSFTSHFASLPASVVLPAPWRPASMMTVGGFFANCSRRCSPPRMATSSSLTICTTCCAGFSALLTSSPSARSRTCAVNCLTTSSETSASSRARRISRTVPSTSAADSLPLVRRFLKVSARRSDRFPKVAMVVRF